MSTCLVTEEDILQVKDRLERAIEEAREKKAIQTCISFERIIEVNDWPKLRPNMSADFPSIIAETHFEPGPTISQEVPLINDILSCYVGVCGQFIYADTLPEPWAVRTFTISSNVDYKLAQLAKKCLDLGADYSMIMRFIQENRKLGVGRVNEALAAAMDNVMDNYILFILELENKKSQLTLHSLWFLIQPMTHPLQTLSKLAKHIATNRCRGADTLNYLLEYTQTLMDKSKEKEVCIFLVERAASPIMTSVQKWIFNGVIYDPFDEFMIVGNPKVQLSKEKFPDEYWSKRYQIRKVYTPSFLKSVEITILNAGKYLNVIRDCLESDWNVKLAAEEDLIYNYKDSTFLNAIERAYKHSSKYLLTLMLDDYTILARIKSVKRFLLLQQGDFVVQLLDSCEEELCQPICDLIPERLATLVEMAIKLPSTTDDEFRDDIQMCLKPNQLTQQVLKILNISAEIDEKEILHTNENLTALEAFTLTVKRTWPVSLFFSVTVCNAYEMLFRHLFYCKYLERLLSRVWLMDKSVRALSFADSKCFSRAFALRHKMLYFIQNIEYYMMEEAIEPNWIEFQQMASTVESIDALIEVHWTFIRKCMKDCLLQNTDLHVFFRKLTSTCQEFCDFVMSLGSLLDLNNHAIYAQQIEILDSQFQDQLVAFFNAISRHSSANDISTRLWNIVLRENYNNYFDDLINSINSNKHESEESIKSKIDI